MDIEEMKSAVDAAVNPVMAAFEAFKAANDERLAAVEAKGVVDPVVADKLAKIEKELDQFENLNQRLTLAEQQAKNAASAADRLEVAMARAPAAARGNGDAAEVKARNNAWLRAAIRAGALGSHNLSHDEAKRLQSTAEEFKALGIVADTAAGYLAPTEYVREIIKGVTLISPVRSLVRVRTTAMKALQIP
jgi:HK97 family phage major capsid protein